MLTSLYWSAGLSTFEQLDVVDVIVRKWVDLVGLEYIEIIRIPGVDIAHIPMIQARCKSRIEELKYGPHPHPAKLLMHI